ncbi:kinase-like protein [Aaosphaeria arxii CBS 175.79]|uniref:Kinase-like protein n=1 Tax=Aaosphaeria arxii CBS 175.79 TaxID=1450172 RepID=A0A6A5XLX1_9PLEO|nr:kinase-like protein [Aaosphaeria arxii CBS 175.79]KAF2013916.1 kinase-like protein [Aaosphaeria arxii CBS 175.79]
MAPLVTKWEDLVFIYEEVDDVTGKFQHTTFAFVDEDGSAYFGKLNTPKINLTLNQLDSALLSISDDEVFPEWSSSSKLTKASEPLPSSVYIKRPALIFYDTFQEHNVLHLIPKGFIEEVDAMEMLSQHPHPNIIKYHGCQVRRGRITGLVLDRHPNTFSEYLKSKVGPIDKEPFMQALQSAISHLHSLHWAHNDLNPSNILINEEGMPVLIDFGSAREVGMKLGTSRGTKGWIDCELKDYHTSDYGHDLFALEKLRTWLDEPTFE